MQTHICLCLASAHTSNLFVYMHISTHIHISYYGHFCTRSQGAETRICLCPCECSQLEPLCVHKYSQVYIFFRSQILLYINPLCATPHMSVPLQALTVRTSSYTCIYPQIYRMMHTCIYSQASKCCIMNTFVMNRCCANSHMSFPWLVLTLRTFLYTCMCSQEYIHSPRNVDNSIKHICAFMYLFIFIYLSTTCVEHSGLVICGETWSS